MYVRETEGEVVVGGALSMLPWFLALAINKWKYRGISFLSINEKGSRVFKEIHNANLKLPLLLPLYTLDHFDI